MLSNSLLTAHANQNSRARVRHARNFVRRSGYLRHLAKYLAKCLRHLAKFAKYLLLAKYLRHLAKLAKYLLLAKYLAKCRKYLGI